MEEVHKMDNEHISTGEAYRKELLVELTSILTPHKAFSYELLEELAQFVILREFGIEIKRDLESELEAGGHLSPEKVDQLHDEYKDRFNEST